LFASIKQGDVLLYISDQDIPVTIAGDSPLTIDIPVVTVRGGRDLPRSSSENQHFSWPQLVGRDGTYAVQYIKKNNWFHECIHSSRFKHCYNGLFS